MKNKSINSEKLMKLTDSNPDQDPPQLREEKKKNKNTECFGFSKREIQTRRIKGACFSLFMDSLN